MSSSQPPFARAGRTSRGALVVGQSGGPTAVINASLVGVVRAALESEQVGGIYGMRYGIRGLLDRDLLDLRAESAHIWDALQHTPSAALGSSRFRLDDTSISQALDALRALGARYFVYIGGNDSADTAHRLAVAAREADYDLRVICVPKTIDNDLPLTDHCPGYGSAARFIALATMDSALCTAAMPDHYPVKFIEVMGRDAGWLAAAAALGKLRAEDPPHLVYVPERPWNATQFLADVEAAHRAFGFVVVVVAETVRDEQGRALGEIASTGVDAFGHPLLSGAAQYLVSLVIAELRLRARFDKPGDLQRMSSLAVSEVDRAEAEQVGRAAVRAALAGDSDKMVTLVRAPGADFHCETGLCALADIANTIRPLPTEYLSATGASVSEAFRAYALPLLGAPLPVYARLGTTSAQA